jgi:hypothetical protein
LSSVSRPSGLRPALSPGVAIVEGARAGALSTNAFVVPFGVVEAIWAVVALHRFANGSAKPS